MPLKWRMFWLKFCTERIKLGSIQLLAMYPPIKRVKLPRFRFALHAINAYFSLLYLTLTACNKNADTIKIRNVNRCSAQSCNQSFQINCNIKTITEMTQQNRI